MEDGVSIDYQINKKEIILNTPDKSFKAICSINDENVVNSVEYQINQQRWIEDLKFKKKYGLNGMVIFEKSDFYTVGDFDRLEIFDEELFFANDGFLGDSKLGFYLTENISGEKFLVILFHDLKGAVVNKLARKIINDSPFQFVLFDDIVVDCQLGLIKVSKGDRIMYENGLRQIGQKFYFNDKEIMVGGFFKEKKLKIVTIDFSTMKTGVAKLLYEDNDKKTMSMNVFLVEKNDTLLLSPFLEE